MPKTVCPNCGKEVAVENSADTAFPFCSERCRLADLDRWFTEDYAIPGEEVPGENGGGRDEER